MFEVVTLAGVIVTEDSATHLTVGMHRFLIYDPMLNRYYDASGAFHSYRHRLVVPFVDFDQAKFKCDQMNTGRMKWIKAQEAIGGN